MLIDGQQVVIRGINIGFTYEGLLLGSHNDELNQDTINDEIKKASQLWGGLKTHIIMPETTERDGVRFIGSWCVKVWLLSTWAQSNFDITELCVIFFTDRDVFKESFEEIVYEQVKNLKWTQIATQTILN